MRRRGADHPIEKVGEKLRAMMPWVGGWIMTAVGHQGVRGFNLYSILVAIGGARSWCSSSPLP